MPITVITGQPGNGKTAYMMEMLEAALKEAKRPIYVHGVEGELPSQARPLADVREWEKCDDGALVFVDEAWMGFGHLQDGSRAPTPPHVLALATHRHRGFDFVMTTQMVNQLFPFMRGLVGEHIHVARKFGTSLCTVYKWGEVCDDVKSQAARERSLSSAWTLPTRLYGKWKSAVMHTIKPRIPWRVVWIPVCFIAALALGWGVIAKMRTPDPDAASADPGVAGTAHDVPGKAAMKEITPETWLEQITPRIAGVHGSQPVFDGRKVQAVPQTFCVVAGDETKEMTTCRCYTEQGTRIQDVLPDRCRTIARWGEYDPFRAPPRQVRQAAPVVVAEAEPEDRVDLGGVAAGTPASIGSPEMGRIQ